MTAAQFNLFWTTNFAGLLPIQHYFKHDFAQRWFRVHSLPQSKRYADTDHEWQILLSRQNALLTDLFGTNAHVLLVTGDYNYNAPNDIHITNQAPAFEPYSFVRLDDIDLHTHRPENYDHGQTYRPAFAEINWTPGKHNLLLRDIANDLLRAFFVSPMNKMMAAPYDGGMDIILPDTADRHAWKEKYKAWLPATEDGY